MAGGGVKQNNYTIQGGADGATFLPSVDANGNLSWSNNKGYSNPPTVNIKGPKGDKGEDGEDGIISISQVQTLISEAKQSMYPIGSYYITDTNENPAQILGFGTWAKIEGRMILGASSTYPAGSIGGNATQTLTINNMPAHSHEFLTNIGGDYSGGIDAPVTSWLPNGSAKLASYLVRESGNGESFSILSPYFAAYIWHRTA